jgi:PhnB protein
MSSAMTAAINPSSSQKKSAAPAARSVAHLQPYVFFNGRCEEAAEFYRRALGAEVIMLLRFKDAPTQAAPSGCPSVSPDKVMHMSLRIGDTELLASDGCEEGKPTFQGFALSLTVPNEAEADRRFAALADGGQVQMPLEKTFFSPRFGMVTDRFGVAWMVYVAPPAAASGK